MSDETLSNMELSIIEIISQHRDIHFLSIMAQIEQMSSITGQSFDKKVFAESLAELEKKGYIWRLPSNPETFGVTEKGRELL
jgi:DNA-binding HxlR family transcriptional regulator